MTSSNSLETSARLPTNIIIGGGAILSEIMDVNISYAHGINDINELNASEWKMSYLQLGIALTLSSIKLYANPDKKA